MVQLRRLLLPACACALVFAAPARAGIWTPINSGTSDSISAISYAGDDKLFFATVSGKIRKENPDGGGSVEKLSAPGTQFNDIAFSPSGNDGLAVGTGQTIYRSTNAGESWTKVSGSLKTYNDAFGSTTANTCTHSENAVLIDFVGDFGAVSFKDEGTAYVSVVSGAEGSVFKTTNGGASFSEASRTATNCRIDTGDPVTDVHAIANTDSVFFVDKDFGRVFFSSNGLSGNAQKKATSVNCFDQRPRLGIDDADASKLFVSDRCTGTLSYEFSSTSGDAFARPDFPDGFSPQGAADVAVKAGNALFPGTGGGIVQTNGRLAVNRPADGALATQNWLSVGMASPSAAVVGGDGGALVRTTQANLPLDITAPQGTINAPFSAKAGVPVPFSATVADEVNGSGINPASFRWTAPGVATASGNPTTLTFPRAGSYPVTLTFADFAGNQGTATTTISIGAGAPTFPIGTANPTPTKTSSVAGGSIKLSGPKTCVPVGKTFSATLSFKKAKKKKKGSLVKVKSVAFSIDGKTVKNDKKAPFKQTLSVKSYAPSSTHTLKARATIKVRKSKKAPKKSIATSFQVCSS